MFTANKRDLMPKWLPMTAIIFLINIILLCAAYYGFEHIYNDKIYPGVRAANIELGGKTGEQARSLLLEKIKNITDSGILVSYGNSTVTLYPVTTSLNADLAIEIISFNADKTIEDALAYGRSNGFITNFKNKLNLLAFGRQIPVTTNVDREKIGRLLKDSFSSLEVPAKNADISYVSLKNGRQSAKKFEVLAESQGVEINYNEGLDELDKKLAVLDNAPLALSSEKGYPQIYQKDVLNIDKKTEPLLQKDPLVLAYGDSKWTIDKPRLASWLHLELNPSYSSSSPASDKIRVVLNTMTVKQYLADKIGSVINKEPVDAKFQIISGKLAKFQSSSDGIELDADQTFRSINSDFFNGTSTQITVAVNTIKSSVGLNEINNLGLNGIIGTGQSNFAGSPKNRRHNIKVGADAVNGTLVKPGEEFSLLKTLGKIDASTGYLTELVIKQNKTTPEFGGGLCQIGTTVFRGALSSGLPITQRQNHSYRVSYYEPAGTDATIYEPWPDFRFLNDTGNYILIQSRIVGDNLYFDYWGTNDGRKVEETKPTIYNIVKPKPPKITETLDLAPGEKKCTEKAHNGADAYFDYKVSYPDGNVKEKRFSSHYVPWQEVCLIGVKQLSASSTPPSLNGTGSATSTAN